MKTRLMFPLMFVAAMGVACGGDDARRGTQQANYETVEEGSAAGVTSTIHGPGEVLPPVTSTNADTTSAFTFDPNAVGSSPAPLPPQMPAPARYPPPQMSSTPEPVPQPPPASPVTREPEPAPPEQTETVAPQQPAQAETEPAPQPEEKKEAEQEETKEPPPPPTTTDTRGQQRSLS